MKSQGKMDILVKKADLGAVSTRFNALIPSGKNATDLVYDEGNTTGKK